MANANPRDNLLAGNCGIACVVVVVLCSCDEHESDSDGVELDSDFATIAVSFPDRVLSLTRAAYIYKRNTMLPMYRYK